MPPGGAKLSLSPDTPATGKEGPLPPDAMSRADVSPVLSATERLSGACFIYLLCNVYWDLVFNNCHSNISFLNPFRSAAVAILNIYQHYSCIRWLGCNFFVIKDLQDTAPDLGRIGRDQSGWRGGIWSWKPLLEIRSWGLPSPGNGGSSPLVPGALLCPLPRSSE